jgi:NADH-quinone oxidoreductase subunit N
MTTGTSIDLGAGSDKLILADLANAGSISFVETLVGGSAADTITLYLSLEMVSITSYILVAYMKGDRMSNEASLKYLVFGAVSAGTMLYGLVMFYGLTGETSLTGIHTVLAGGLGTENRLAVYAAALLVMVGLGFKVAAVPFHFWCPDAYQGAPTPVTALLSVVPKVAGLAVIVRFFFTGLSLAGTDSWDLQGIVDWPLALMVVSAVTMTVGNVAALTQTNMKRMLAYSSIAHAGYALMGVVALSRNGLKGVLVYVVSYVIMNLGAFLVVNLVHASDGTFDVRDYPGLSRRSPYLAFTMAVFLLSLVGIPPLVGFMGKLYVFGAVIERGPSYAWFAVVGALNAAVAAYYYFRVLRTMVIDPGNEDRGPITLALADRLNLGALALANFVLPVLLWTAVEVWTSGALVLWAGR